MLRLKGHSNPAWPLFELKDAVALFRTWCENHSLLINTKLEYDSGMTGVAMYVGERLSVSLLSTWSDIAENYMTWVRANESVDPFDVITRADTCVGRDSMRLYHQLQS